MDSDQLTPMVIGPGGQHFFVNEFATTKDGRVVVPIKWIIVDDRLSGECWLVSMKVRPFDKFPTDYFIKCRHLGSSINTMSKGMKSFWFPLIH